MNDEQIKRIFGDNSDIINAFSKINAIEFQYNNKAKEIDPSGMLGIDDDTHIGIKAQELHENPITSSVVEEQPNGYLAVNTKELTTTNTAVLSEVCKKIVLLEQKINELEGVIYGR